MISGPGNGPLPIQSGKTLELGSTEQNVIYVGFDGVLKLDDPASFTGMIAGLGLGDTIEFANTTITNASVNGSTLTVTELGGEKLTFAISGALSGNYFALRTDGSGGSDLVLSTIASTAAQYYSDFRSSLATLNTAIADGADQSQIAADMISVYVGAISGAIEVIGNTNWQNAYDSSNQAASNLRTALINGASSGLILSDTAALYGSIIAGAVSVIAGNGSQQTYQSVAAAAATMGADIAGGVSGSQLQSDLTALLRHDRGWCAIGSKPISLDTSTNSKCAGSKFARHRYEQQRR